MLQPKSHVSCVENGWATIIPSLAIELELLGFQTDIFRSEGEFHASKSVLLIYDYPGEEELKLITALISCKLLYWTIY